MAEGHIEVTEGSGKKLRGWSETVGANTVLSEYVLRHDAEAPSYAFTPGSVSVATTNSHILQLMAGASLPVRVRRNVISQFGLAGAVYTQGFHIIRLTTAGTGGTAHTPRQLDDSDAGSGATGMTLPTAKGTEALNSILRLSVGMVAAEPVTGVNEVVWREAPGMKPLIIPAGTANGIAIKTVVTSSALATVVCSIEFTEGS